MEAYTILLNSIVLIGVGIIIGISVILSIMNGRINKLKQEIAQINKNLNRISNDDFYFNSENKTTSKNRIKSYPNMVNFMSYRSEVDSKNAVINESDYIQSRVNANQTIGIVFCRNCASQFTSDKEACPICGAKRH